MRHNKKFNHLSRKANHRAAMLSNMACSLIMHKRISTTLAKAKALRIYVEPILTRAKEDNMNNRRLAFSLLKQKEVVTELFQNVGEKIANRPGGYTRILAPASVWVTLLRCVSSSSWTTTRICLARPRRLLRKLPAVPARKPLRKRLLKW